MIENKSVNIHFKLIGNEMNEVNGYDLYYLSQSMEAFHLLMEKTYLSLKDEKYMSKSKREDLKIKVHNIRPGSFEADFAIWITSGVTSLLPMVTPINSRTIWDMTMSSYAYLKAVLEANSKGEILHMEANNSENVQVINAGGDVIINVHPDVVMTSKEVYPVFKRIANLIDTENDSLTKTVFSDVNNQSEVIEIGVKEKTLLKNENTLEEEAVEFIGKIFNADSIKYTGKVMVSESDSIETGEYTFDFLDKRNNKVRDYYDIDCEFTALKSTSFNPDTLSKKIAKLRIINARPLEEVKS